MSHIPTVTMTGKFGRLNVNTSEVAAYKKKGYEVVDESKKPAPAPDPADTETLSDLSAAELKELAEKAGVEGWKSMSKPELL